MSHTLHTLTYFSDENINDNPKSNAAIPACDDDYEAIEFENEPFYENPSEKATSNVTSYRSALSIPTVLPVSVYDLGEFVLNCHGNGNEGFSDQFQVNHSLDVLSFTITQCRLISVVTL